jgi:hypothetical protein
MPILLRHEVGKTDQIGLWRLGCNAAPPAISRASSPVEIDGGTHSFPTRAYVPHPKLG